MKFLRVEALGLALALILAAGFRLHGLTTQSLWLDELYSVWISPPHLSFAEILARNTPSSGHPMLYPLLLWGWFNLVQYDDGAARLLSAFLGIAGVLGIYLLGRELFSRRVGLLAAWLLAVNYFHIYYSQEVRSYALVFLLTCAAHLFFWRLMVHGTRRAALLYGLAAAALMHTHNFGLFVVASHWISTRLWTMPAGGVGSRALGLGVSAALYAPWLPFLGSQIIRVRPSWIPAPKPWFVGEYFVQYFGAGHLAIAAGALLLIGSFKTIARTATESKAGVTQDRRSCYFLLLTTLAAYTFPYLASMIGQPILHPRYTIIALPGLLVLIALGLARIDGRTSVAVMSVGFLTLSVIWLMGPSRYYTSVHKQQWREAIHFIADQKNPGDLILSAYPQLTQYYLDQKLQSLSARAHPASVALLRRFLSRDENAAGVWLFTAHQAGGLLIPDQVQDLLRRRFVVSGKRRFFDARVLYLRPRRGRVSQD